VTRLLVVRHGQSVWNAERRWQGRADPPLSELGRRQAAAAEPGDVDVVVTSPLRRAHETAEILAAATGAPLAEVHADLQERAAGEWTGLTRAEIARRYPGAPGSGRRPPGYEPDADVRARVERRFHDLASRHRGRNVLVVTHGGVIGVAAAMVDAVAVGDIVPVPNLGGFVVTLADGRFASLRSIHLLAADRETTSPLE
jgi:probable phosphoglycerate mutase